MVGALLFPRCERGNSLKDGYEYVRPSRSRVSGVGCPGLKF